MEPKWRPVAGEKVEYLGQTYEIEVVDHSRAGNLYIRNGDVAYWVSHFTVKPIVKLLTLGTPDDRRFDLERSLNRLNITRPDIASRAIPLSEIPDIDPIVLVQ